MVNLFHCELNNLCGDGAGTQATFNLEGHHENMIYVYPDAEHNPETNSPAWFFEPDSIDFAFFDALIDELQSNYCVDTSRIFATGASAGGIFRDVVLCQISSGI